MWSRSANDTSNGHSITRVERARGFRDQNAGPGAGWLVAAGVSKKKNGLHQFLAGSSFVEH